MQPLLKVLCGVSLLALACGSSDSSSGAAATGASCEPGSTNPCPCTDGTSSTQTCLPTGDAYGPCACSDTPPASTGTGSSPDAGSPGAGGRSGGGGAPPGSGGQEAIAGAPSGGATAGGGGTSGGGMSGAGAGGTNAAGAGGAGAGGTNAAGAGGAGAGGTSAAGAGGASGMGGSGGAAPTTGCGSAAPMDSGTIDVAGAPETRTYILDLPATYDPNQAYPLVFGFHGATSSASAFSSQFYGNLGGPVGDDAIIVYPDALAVNGTTSWSHDSDVAFFDALVDKISSGYCVDEARIFATGHSSGGFFTNRLGCERGDVLRAIAPLAAGGPAFCIDQNRTAGELCQNLWLGTPCVGEVAVWIEHGENDDVVDIQQGLDSRQFWGDANGCDVASESPVDPSPCVALGGCDSGLPVHFCVSPGAGHEPHPSLTGPGAWGFFASF